MKINKEDLYIKKSIVYKNENYHLKQTGYTLKQPAEVIYSIKLLESLSEFTEDILIVEVNIKAEIKVICDRCLKDFIYKHNCTLKDEFKISEIENEIDVDEEIRQYFVVSLPMKFLCKPDCKGLCAVCGNDLNKEKCKCKKTGG